MKKLFLVCLFLMGMSVVSFAQGGGGFNQTPDERVATLKTQVTGITDDQAAKLKSIYTVTVKTQDSLRNAMQGGGDFQSMMPKFMTMMTTTDTKIMAVLTPEQAAAYKKIADARMEQMKQRMQGN